MTIAPLQSRSKWRAYSEYTESGSPILGVIPRHWKTGGLKRLCTLAYGDSLANDDREPGKVRVFGSNGPIGAHNRPNTKAPVIVVGRKGSYGKLQYSAEEVFAIDTTYFIDPRHTRAHIRWLFFLLSTLDLDAYSEDSAVPGLSRDAVYAHTVPIVPLDEQRAIAAFLDRETAQIDALIAKKERLIALLQEKRTALISHAVTKGLDPTVPTRDSGIPWIGHIPAHWEVVPLKRAADVQTGLTLGRRYEEDQALTSRPYLRVANVQDGYLDLETITTVEIPPVDAVRYELRAGDVLMTEGGDNDKLGRGYVWNDEIPGCLHQNHIFAVRPNQCRLAPQFLTSLMSSAHGRAYFTSTSKQSTNLASTNSSTLRQFPIPLPPIDEQIEIARWIDDQAQRLDLLSDKVREHIRLLQEHRTALISAAVTGKIDVRSDVV